MSEQSYAPSVLKLAHEAGVTTDWVDAWGGHQRVTQDDLLAVLGALTGRELAIERDIEQASADLAASRPEIEPVVVAWDGIVPVIEVPSSVVSVAIALEDGGEVGADIVDDRVTIYVCGPTVQSTGFPHLLVSHHSARHTDQLARTHQPHVLAQARGG